MNAIELELRAQGFSYSAIAKRLDISKGTAYRRCRRLEGVEHRTCVDCGTALSDPACSRCRPCYEARNADQNKRILKRWQQGEPQESIAHSLGISQSSVSARIERMRRRGPGIPRGRRKHRAAWSTLLHLRSEGCSNKEIAEILNTTPNNVSQMFRRMTQS